MKCPMSFMGTSPAQAAQEESNCINKRCAWWDEENQTCWIVTGIDCLIMFTQFADRNIKWIDNEIVKEKEEEVNGQ